jgi:hypothetical protein
MLGVFFKPEDGGNMFLRNVRLFILHGIVTHMTSLFKTEIYDTV